MPTTDAKSTESNHATISRKATKVIRDQKQWSAIFEARRKSGLSVEGFCSANNIGRSAYWKWSKRLGAPKGATVTKTVESTFLPIPITATAPVTSAIEMELGTMRVRFDGPATERVIDAIIKRIAMHA